MKIRKTKKTWRNGLGLGQIMATLLVVLPTMAFSVTFLISYWNVMQVDYSLKLIANMAADYANSSEDPQSDFRALNGSSNFELSVSKLCPQGRAITVKDSNITDADTAGEISIVIEYTTPSTDSYLAGELISTKIQTYSYHDQNMSVTLTCPNK